MSNPRPSNLPDFPAQAKLLIANHPGQTAALLDNGQLVKVMTFKDAHGALAWAEKNKVPFFYMPPDDGKRN